MQTGGFIEANVSVVVGLAKERPYQEREAKFLLGVCLLPSEKIMTQNGCLPDTAFDVPEGVSIEGNALSNKVVLTVKRGEERKVERTFRLTSSVPAGFTASAVVLGGPVALGEPTEEDAIGFDYSLDKDLIFVKFE